MSALESPAFASIVSCGKRDLDPSHNGCEKGGRWAAFLGCARWEGARRHPLRHQLSWKAGERAWEQRSISLCRQGDSQPISEGIDFSHQKIFFVFLFAKEKTHTNQPPPPPLFKHVLFIFFSHWKCFIFILRKNIDNFRQNIVFTWFHFAKTIFCKRGCFCVWCMHVYACESFISFICL